MYTQLVRSSLGGSESGDSSDSREDATDDDMEKDDAGEDPMENVMQNAVGKPCLFFLSFFEMCWSGLILNLRATIRRRRSLLEPGSCLMTSS